MMQGIDRAPLVVVNGLILHVSAPGFIHWCTSINTGTSSFILNTYVQSIFYYIYH